MKKLSIGEVNSLAKALAKTIHRHYTAGIIGGLCAYAIPGSGLSAALAVINSLHGINLNSMTLTDRPEDADFFIDAVMDKGTVMQDWCDRFPGKPFYALVVKAELEYRGEWVVFPWESTMQEQVKGLLVHVGDDPTRGGLLDTPKRVAKAWGHWCSGYSMNVEDILKVFEDGAEQHDQMITVEDIPIYSHCEHHLAPIFGTATISYIPNGKIVGLSKLSRVADMYARRLQVQERLTDQIADALYKHLNPKGVGVVIKARHMCMESRGICQQGHRTITTALRGAMREEAETRSEFLRLAK